MLYALSAVFSQNWFNPCIGLTGMVHPLKFAEFYEEMFRNIFKSVAIWHVPHILLALWCGPNCTY